MSHGNEAPRDLSYQRKVERDNKIMQNKTTLPPEGPSHRLIEATEKCKSDLSIMFCSLSKEIYGAPWSGPGVKVYTSLLREEDGCT